MPEMFGKKAAVWREMSVKYAPYLLLAGAGCFILCLWIGDALPEFMRERERLAETKPLRTEARALALTYEQVLKDPEVSVGKPVIWCMQNRGEHQVTVKGEAGKRVEIVNHTAMPAFMGDKHAGCADMLLVVTKVAVQWPRVSITARFVQMMQ